MTRPVRITLSRAPGWRMPRGAIKVDRSSILGNPWTVGSPGRFFAERRGCGGVDMDRALTAAQACELHRLWLLGEFGCAGGVEVDHPRVGRIVTPHGHAEVLAMIGRLRGADLACWCPAQAHGETCAIVHCHADTLLVLANAEDDGGWAAARAGWRAAVPLKSRLDGREMAA